MESFLSLPRSAKGGIAVLLAVALLGWAIVAYSAKQQHEDARSLESTLATLKSQGDREETAVAELQSLQERLTAAETELATSRDAVSTTQQEKSDLEAELAELETEFAVAREQSESAPEQAGALTLLDSQGEADDGSKAAGESTSADTGDLRARLTRTMTALSAKSATLQQRERDLARAMERAEAAEAEVQTLTADVEAGKAVRERLTNTMTALSAKSATLQQLERQLAQALERAEAAETEVQTLTADVEAGNAARGRLTNTMTALSAKSATLQQRERQLARALERAEAAEAEVQTLTADVEAGEAVRGRLTGTMTALSAKSATLQQRDRDIDDMKAEQASVGEKIATLEAEIAERDEAGRSLEALTTKFGKTERALKDSADTLEKNRSAIAEQDTRLQTLKDEQASIEALIAGKQSEVSDQEQKLASLAESVGQKEQQLASQQQETERAKAELADLRAAQEDSSAEGSALTAEIDSLQSVLSEKEDELASAKSELADLLGAISSAEKQLAETNDELAEKQAQLSARNADIQGLEASLDALKDDRATAEAETVELKVAINRQQAALEDLAAYKGELDATKAELADQAALLDEKRIEIANTDAQIIEARKSLDSDSSTSQSLPQIPIAALSTDNPAVLPIDPLQHPFPVQTKNGVRLALVHFDLGSAELSPGGLRRAREAAAWIKERGVEKIRLVGATDTIGTFENNMELARRRAQTLFDTFAAEGIDPDRIELISRGEEGGSETIADQTAEPLNRCVGVFIEGG